MSSPINYIQGRVRVFGAGSVVDLDVNTTCVRVGKYDSGALFESTWIYKTTHNTGDTGPEHSRDYSPTPPRTIGECMGHEVYVKPADGGTRGVRCRVESAVEALGRADMAILLLENKVALAEAKRELAEAKLSR